MQYFTPSIKTQTRYYSLVVLLFSFFLNPSEIYSENMMGCPEIDSVKVNYQTICSGDIVDISIFHDFNSGHLGLYYDLKANGIYSAAELYGPAINFVTEINDSIPSKIGIGLNEISFVGSDSVEIYNYGIDTVDIATWWLCSNKSYLQLSASSVASGDLNLPPGESVVVHGLNLDDSRADVGLYMMNDFTDPDQMVDFVQYGDAANGTNGREDVAVAKGIWTAGSFVSTSGMTGGSISYDGVGLSDTDWQELATHSMGSANANMEANLTTTLSGVMFPANTSGAPISYYLYAILGHNNSLRSTCEAYQVMEVTVQHLDSLVASDDVEICLGDTHLLGTNGGSTFEWSPDYNIDDVNSQTPTVFPQSDTSYFVTITDAVGCKYLDTVIVDVHDLPSYTTLDTIVCPGSIIELTSLFNEVGSTAGEESYYSTLSDSEDQTNPLPVTSFAVFTSNTYYLRKNLTVDSLCYTIDSVSVDVSDIANLETFEERICIGSTVSLDILVTDLSNIPGDIDYYDTRSDAEMQSNELATTSVSPSSTRFYYVRKNSSTGSCFDLDSIKISVTLFPLFDISTGTICKGDFVRLDTFAQDVNGTTGVTAYYSSLTDAEQEQNFIFPAVVNPDSTTTYYIRKNTSSIPQCSTIDSIIVDVTNCTFDLALRKRLAIGQPSVVNQGDTVNFEVALFNQGNRIVYNINILDYMPEQAVLADPAWTENGSNASFTVSSLAPGDSTKVNIAIQVGENYQQSDFINAAEVTFATNAPGSSNNLGDEDSFPDGNPFNDVGGRPNVAGEDDNIDDDGTIDEDDHDVAQLSVFQEFDLALRKTLASGESGTYLPGDTVNFTVSVFNQGTLDAYDISISDYTGTNFIDIDPGWFTPSDTLRYFIPSLSAKDSIDIPLRLKIDPNFTDTIMINFAEVTYATQIDGSSIKSPDADSSPDSYNDNDTGGDPTDPAQNDNIDDDGTIDEDDHDGALISITQGFDLALRKRLKAGQSTIVYPGDMVNYTIQVFNQGISDAYDIQVTDYVPSDMTLVDVDWTMEGTNAVRNIDFIAKEDTATVDITLQIDPGFSGNNLENAAEISFGSQVDGSGENTTDLDSDADTLSTNDIFIDDEILDRRIVDEDDHDKASITVCDITISTSLTNPTCFEGTDGSIVLTVSGGSGIFSYSWDNGAGFNKDLSGVAAGTYTVTVTDNLGCISTSTMVLIDPLEILITPDLTAAFCDDSNGTIELNVSGGSGSGYVYDWEDDSFDGSSIASNIFAGTYTVTVSDGLACSKDTIIDLPGTGATIVEDSIVQPTCFGDTDAKIFLTISGGLPGTKIIDWGNPLYNGMSEIEDLAPGRYSVTVSELAGGCSFSALYVIQEPLLLQADVSSSDVSCNGGSDGSIDLSIRGGTEPYTILWDQGLTPQQDHNNLSAGTYRYTFTDANGCGPVIDSVTINDVAIFETTVTADNNEICEGDTIKISASSASTYSWTGPNSFTSTDQNIVIANAMPNSEGNYLLTSQNGNGCEDTTSINISILMQTNMAVVEDSISVCNYNYGGNDNVANLDDLVKTGDRSGFWRDPANTGSLLGNTFTAQLGMEGNTYTVEYVITGEGGSGSCSDNVYFVKIVVLPCVFDVSLDKSLTESGGLGDTIQYVITITNEGDLDIYDVVVHDYLPDGLIFYSSLNPLWTNNNDTLSYSFDGPLPPSLQIGVPIRAVVDSTFSGNFIVNKAEVIAASHEMGGPATLDIDSRVNNDDGDQSEDDEDFVNLFINTVFDIALEKTTMSSLPASPGDTILFQIAVVNEGEAPAYDLGVEDDFGEGLSFIVSENPGWTEADGKATYIVSGPLNPGDTAFVEIKLEVEDNTVLRSTYNKSQLLQASDVPDGDSAPDFDSSPGNDDGDQSEDDESMVVIPITQLQDISLLKSLSSNQLDSIFPGDTVVYDIVITNNGNLPVYNLEVTDFIDQNHMLNSTQSHPWNLQGDDAKISFEGPLESGFSTSFTISLASDELMIPEQEIRNVASVSGGTFDLGGTDPILESNSMNNTDSVSIYVKEKPIIIVCNSLVVKGVGIIPESCNGRNGIVTFDIDSLELFDFSWSPDLGNPSLEGDHKRVDLPNGNYEITIFETLQPSCSTIINITVEENCLVTKDKITVTLESGSQSNYCLDDNILQYPGVPTSSEVCNVGNINTASVSNFDGTCFDITTSDKFQGVSTDTICVISCYNGGNIDCDTTLICVNVSAKPCIEFFEDERRTLTQSDCEDNFTFLMEPNYLDFYTFYQIEINGESYTEPLDPGGLDTLSFYTLGLFPDLNMGGPYVISNWNINGVDVTDTVPDFDSLAIVMSNLDSRGTWTYDSNANQIVGGSQSPTYTYGALYINRMGSTIVNIIELNTVLEQVRSGIQLTEGEYEIIVADINGFCPDTMQLINSCISKDIVIDTIPYQTMRNYCLNLDQIVGNIQSVENSCSSGEGIVQFGIDAQTACIDFTGSDTGMDTLCFVICDDLGICDTTDFYFTVIDTSTMLPDAVTDLDSVGQGDMVIIDVRSNDDPNNADNFIQILSQPPNGTLTLDPPGALIYTPNPGYCNDITPDSMTYLLCNNNGCDTASIFITVFCDDITVHNGFSPNGDGVNDYFTILGLNSLEYNKLEVFSRWGNLVYEKEFYDNSWDGSWDGMIVPDGTYFYVLQTSKRRKDRKGGWLQILR